MLRAICFFLFFLPEFYVVYFRLLCYFGYVTIFLFCWNIFLFSIDFFLSMVNMRKNNNFIVPSTTLGK